jgi:hypothetical protein
LALAKKDGREGRIPELKVAAALASLSSGQLLLENLVVRMI